MFDYDKWQEIFGTLRKNKVRSLLTMFGVFWGIFMLMILMGSGKGLENGVTQEFSGWASNSAFLWSNRTTMPYKGLQPGRFIRFTNEDREALLREVDGIEYLAPRLNLQAWNSGNNVTRKTKSGAFRVFGDYPEYQKIQSVDMIVGRHLNPLDLAEHRKVCVVGRHVYEVLFEKEEDPINEYISINGIYFRVIGVFKSKRKGNGAEWDEQLIEIPFTTFQRAFNMGNRVHWFGFTARPGLKVSEVEASVRKVLMDRHRIHPDDRSALGSENLEEEFGRVFRLFNGIRVFVWIVGIGTLLAGVIGVSNIMLIVVKERTKEIGIRKSLGATPASIIALIMQESVFITALAGYLGLVVGNALLAAISYALEVNGADTGMFKNPEISFNAALMALLVLLVSGALAGLIPASKAVNVNPVEALHSE